MRPLRHIPPKEPGERTLVEVTCRTVQGLFLLRPEPGLNRLLLGVLGKAQQRTGTALHSIEVLSSHLLCRAAHKACYVERRVMWS